MQILSLLVAFSEPSIFHLGPHFRMRGIHIWQKKQFDVTSDHVM